MLVGQRGCRCGARGRSNNALYNLQHDMSAMIVTCRA